MNALYDNQGQRKYITTVERRQFMHTASLSDPKNYTFCATLALSGARISEVLALTPQCIDYETGVIMIESLKKRRRGIYRPVPIPTKFLEILDSVHEIRMACHGHETAVRPLWPWCRTTAWKRVKGVMTQSGITGTQASPKGLRHGFAVGSLHEDIPINFVRKWLGHSRLSTTEIYCDAIGQEEREIAQKYWNTFNM